MSLALSKTQHLVPADAPVNIPAHWRTQRAKYLFREVDDRSVEGLELHLSMSQKEGLVPSNSLSERRLESETYVGGKLCKPGDLVLNRLKAHLGVFAVSRHFGVVSPDYTVLRRRTPQADPEYFELVLKSPYYRAELVRRTKGLVEGFWRLYTDDFNSIRLPLPELSEQEQIVRVVSWIDSKVSRLLGVKRDLIALLNEQKQAIIHGAVTRGIKSGSRLVPSGLPWVPEFPAHWALVPNGSLMKPKKRLVGNRHTEFALLSLTKQGVIVRDLSENKGKFSKDMGTSQEVKTGDLVFCLFDIPETPRTVGLSARDGMITSAYTVMQPRDPEIGAYLAAFYIAMDDQKLLSPMYSGLRNTIAPSRFLSMKMPLPPKEERSAIVEHIRTETAGLDLFMKRTAAEIDLLREYRQRLVADVVMGQFDLQGLDLTRLTGVSIDLTPDLSEIEQSIENEEDVLQVVET